MPARRAGSAPRFLVIGCGSIGKRHIGNLLALGAEHVHAVDVRADCLRDVETLFGIETTDDLDAAWKGEPEVALITVPTSLHVEKALPAAQQGCHLFIEKPLSDRLEGIDRLLQVVKERRLITLVGCNLRFHPGLVRIKELVDAGAIGRIVAARVEAGQYLPDWHPWEDYGRGYSARRDLGGGVILDAIHEIDYVRWLLGEVAAIACFAGKLSHLEIETEDTAAILLRFHNGSIGEIHLDYVQRAYSRTCQLIGDEGTIRWDYVAGEVRYYSAVTREWQVFQNPPDWEPNQMYLDELRHFLRCLALQEQPTLDVFEGSRVLEIALAARASAVNDKIIQLPARWIA